MKTRIITIIIGFLVFIPFTEAQNNALQFDGSDDYVITNLSSSASSVLTIEFWVYFNSLSNQQNLVHINDGGDLMRIVPYKDASNQICLFTADASGNAEILAGNFYVTADQWYHLAFVYDDRDAYIYVNGILQNSSTLYYSYALDGTDRLYLAADYGTGFISDIKMDEFRLWNDVRTENEIRQNMHRELPNPSGESNLVVYYKLNETSGTSAEDAKGSNNGTLNNYGGQSDYWQTSSAMFGPKNCLEFDGNNDYVHISTFNPSFSQGTISFWINPHSILSKHSRILSDYWDDDEIYIYSGVGNVATWHMIDGDELMSSNPLPVNEWTHVAITMDNTSSKLYINGILDDESGPSDTEILSNLQIGGYSTSGNPEVVNGYLDEFCIWSDVRTAEEIRETMCKNLTGNEANLIAYYTFDNTKGTTLQDFSGNGNDGTLTNMDSNSDWVSSTAFNTWLNTSSTDPTTATNWSRCSTPTSSDNVGIYSFSGNDPSVSSTFDCNHFYLQSGASITLNDGASFINAGNIVVDGNFTINKTLTADNKWHLISIPNNNTTANHFFGDYLQNWNENTGLWEQISDETTPLVPVKSYAFWGTQSKATYSFTGDPNSGNQSIALTVNGSGGSYNRANAVGNPYPSSIDWDLVSGYGAKYTWNGTAYEAYPATGGYGTGPRYAAPCQGFFVIPASSGTFTLNNSMRTHSGADGFEKQNRTISNGLVLYSQTNDYQDKLVIAFKDDSSDDFDFDLDAFKILSNTDNLCQLYSISNNHNFSIDIRPDVEVIQLGFQNTTNGNYAIGLLDINEIASAELEDSKLNQFHDLTKGPYSFDWEIIDSEERFILHLKATATDDLEEQDIQVYSANGQLYIRMNQSDTFDQLIIYDVAGRLIAEKPIRNQEIQSFDFNHLSGTYLIQLIGSNKNFTRKISL